MNESGYTQSIGKKVKDQIYWLKIMMSFNNGVPDVWCSGDKDDLWIEVKYLKAIPKKPTTIIIPKLSALQDKWLTDRYNEGRNVCVVLGSPIGAFIFTDLTWKVGVTRFQLTMKPKEVAQWILKKTQKT